MILLFYKIFTHYYLSTLSLSHIIKYFLISYSFFKNFLINLLYSNSPALALLLGSFYSIILTKSQKSFEYPISYVILGDSFPVIVSIAS